MKQKNSLGRRWPLLTVRPKPVSVSKVGMDLVADRQIKGYDVVKLLNHQVHSRKVVCLERLRGDNGCVFIPKKLNR